MVIYNDLLLFDRDEPNKTRKYNDAVYNKQ